MEISALVVKIETTIEVEKKELLLFQHLPNSLNLNRQNLLDLIPLVNANPSRHVLSRLLVSFNKDSRSIFDSISALHLLLSDKKYQFKQTAIHLLGSLELAGGDLVLSLFAESANIIVKIFKNATDLSLKNECLIALVKTIKGAGRGASDQTVKDLLKIAKTGLTDKILLIRSAIYTSTSIPYCTSSSEMETLLSTIIRALENSNNQVRQDVADTISTILELSQQKTIKNEKSNEVKPVLTVEEMFTILNTLFIKSYTREVKIGIFECHASLLKKLSIKFLEKNYVSIANIFINFAALPKLVVNWNDTLMIRDSCGFLLRIIGKTLGEVGQVSALQELNNILLKWTGVDSTNSKYSYTLILIEAAALLIDIGSAASSIQDSLCDSFLALMNHPSESVNIALAWALRCLCFSLPYLLPKLLSKLLPIMEKDASILSSDKPEIFKKFSSYSLVVASLITVIPHKPFSVSFEYIAKVFGLASSLIKASTGTIKDLKVSQAQSQTGWILVSSIMTLGPNFVREHLSQLLMFWKTVFTKNTSSKDKSEAEVLCWVTTRDSALSALYNFLHYNSKSLVTNDVTKRIIVCLNNCSTYDSPILYVTVPPSKNTIMFAEKELSMKRRLFACYSNLNTKLFDSSHHLLLRLAIETFAPEPDKVSDRGALISLIDKSSAQVFDYYSSNSLNDISRNNVSDGIGIRFFKDSQLSPYSLNCVENDPWSILNANPTSQSLNSINTRASQNLTEQCYILPKPCIVSILATDSAIELFTFIFIEQNSATQEATIDLFTKLVRNNKGSQSRRNTLCLNLLTAILRVLIVLMNKKIDFKGANVAIQIREFAIEFLLNANDIIRQVSSEILGRLCRIVGTSNFVNMLTQTLVDKVINIREPEARAGASLALGSIQNYVGGMAAGSQLKTIVGIFHSLAADPHPLVHKYALFALWMTIDSAGLIYGVHVNSTLALVSKLFMSECHEMTAPLANTSNAESNSEVYPCLGRILYSLLGVVGPELSDSAKTRDLCTSLYEELKNDRDPFVMVEALKCIQHFILFSPKHLDINSLVPFLQLQLTSSNRHSYLKRKSAITCLYQLVQRDPENVLKAAVKNQLEEQLFSLLDVEPDNAVQLEIKDILLLLLKYVAPISYSRWLDLCKGILSRTNSTTVSESHGVGPERQDDDETYRVAEVSPSVKPNADLVVLIPRWRTQVFALNCLRDVLVVLNQTGVREHFCLSLARSTRESNDGTGDFLVFKLNELVRIAFNAATAHVLELNVSGLHLLDDILEHYASANDPDFDCHSLLEQYQAQISAALTPAFSIDSAVLIQSLACKVSATYISSGVNKEAGALGRVLKSLTLCLEAHKKEISGPNTSPHGHLLLRLSILNAWAKIQNSSSSLAVAKQIIEPCIPTLIPMWISALRDYSKVRADIESNVSGISSGTSDSASALEMYVLATRELIMPYYKMSWVSVLRAVTSLITSHEDLLLPIIGCAEEQSKIFYSIFGLCIEAISTSGIGAASSTKQDTNGFINILESLKCILGRKVLGDSFNNFIEMMNVFDGINQTEDLKVQLKVLEIIHQIVLDYGKSHLVVESASSSPLLGSLQYNAESVDVLNVPNSFGSKLPPDSMLYKIVSLLFNVFVFHVPLLSISANRSVSEDSSRLLVTAANIFSSLILLGDSELVRSISPIALFLFISVLGTEKLAQEVGTKLMIPIRSIIEQINDGSEGMDLVVETFAASLLDILYPDGFDSKIQEPNSDGEIYLVKNAMLTMIIILTTRPGLGFNANVLAKYASFLENAIDGNSQVIAVTALQCIRALSSSAASSDSSFKLIEISRFIIKSLGSSVLKLVLKLINGDSKPESVLFEAFKLICEWCLNTSITSEDFSQEILAIEASLLIRLLKANPQTIQERTRHDFALEMLLKLATQTTGKFKHVVGYLDLDQKQLFEDSVKTFVAASNVVATPSITLKNF